MKKVSDNILRRLNEIEPENLIGIVERVDKPKLEFICPNCGNGSGSDKTGVEPFDAGDHIGYHCVKCEEKFNNVSLVRAAKHLDFVDAVKLLAPIAGITESDIFGEGNGDGEYHARQRAPEVAAQLRVEPEHDTTAQIENDAANIGSEGNTERDGEREKIAAVIRDELTNAENKRILENFCENCGGSWRGLPLDILRRHGCVYSLMWQSPKSKIEGKSYAPSKRILIPCDVDNLTSYLARATEDDAAAPKIHCGNKSLFFSDKTVLEGVEPVFIVEGFIDAMSIEFAGYSAVATGGIGGGSLLIDYLKEKAVRPKLIILFDSDSSGRGAAPKLRDALTKMKIPAVMKFLQLDGEGDKVDANEILENQGVDVLQRRLREIFDSALPELERLDKKVDAQIKTDASDAARDETRSVDTGEGIEDSRKATPKDIDERRQKLLQLLDSKEPKNKFDTFEIYGGDSGGFEDKDFAGRIAKFSGRYIRWIKKEECWLTYDSAEGVWYKSRRDSSSAVFAFGSDLADFCDANAGDNEYRQKVAKKLKKSRTITGAIKYLCANKSLWISEKDLDVHPELLNCSNCVVDLVTGKSYRQRPELLLTQKTAAEYHSNVDTGAVMKFFEDIQPNEETRAALLRWLGYCLTAETSADKFAIWTGSTGCNGKSTLSAFVLKTLGEDYTTTITADAITLQNKRKDGGNTATTALNVVEGRRFGIVEEISSAAILDSSRIKTLSGGDILPLRRNYGEYKNINPSIKLNISGNFMPKLESIVDGGLLRRLLNFNFGVKFGTPQHPMDENLMDRLLQPKNKSALLKILIAEAQQWYRDGLIISDEMYQTRDRHLQENDFVKSFVNENGIVTDKKESVTAKVLLEDLKHQYPAECSRFKRNDLIKMVENVTGAKYTPVARRPAQFVGISMDENAEEK